MQNVELLRILNDFRKKMETIDYTISDTEFRALYDLLNRSSMSIDDIRKRVYERFKKYKELHSLCKDIETVKSNYDLLDLDFKKTGITLNYQDIDILTIISYYK